MANETNRNFIFENGTLTRNAEDEIYNLTDDYNCIDLVKSQNYANELDNKNFFLEGLKKHIKKNNINIDTSDLKTIKTFIRKKYKEKGLEWESYRKNIDSWLSKGNVSTNINTRSNLYDFCMAMDMSLNETAEFFLKHFLTLPFNYKDRVDAIYYYCIRKDYGMDKVNYFKNESSYYEENYDNKSTIEVENINDIDSDEDFLNYLKFNVYNKVAWNNRIKAKIKDEIEKLFDANDSLKGQKNDVLYMSRLCCFIYGKNFQETNKDNKIFYYVVNEKLPSLFKHSLPREQQFSELRTNAVLSYETLRKMLIILRFFNYFGSCTEENIDDAYDEFKDELNKTLSQCGFITLYERHPFDWLILRCAYSCDPIEVFQELIGIEEKEAKPHSKK